MWSKTKIILIVSISLLNFGFGFNFVFGVESQVPVSITPIGELQSQLNQTQKQRDDNFAELKRLINLKESAEKSLEEVKKKGDEGKIYKDQITQIESDSRRLTEDIASQSKQINKLNRAIEQKIKELKKTPEFMGTYDPAMFQTPGRLPGLIDVGPAGGPEYVRRDFVSFLKWLFPFMLSVAAFLAVLMIVIAGTRWVTSTGSEAEIKAAKGMIMNAIAGLILAFAAWLIIETINPDILKDLRGQIKTDVKIVLIDRI